MSAIKSQHSRVFEKLVAEHRQLLLESLMNNLDPRIAGRIDGLAEALKLSEQADYNISGDEPDVRT